MPSLTNERIRHQTIKEVGSLELDNGYTVSFDESGALAIKGHGVELYQYPRYLQLTKYNTTPIKYELKDCGWVLDIPEQNVIEFQEFSTLEVLEPRELSVAKPYKIENIIELKAAISELKAKAEFDKKDGYSAINVDIDLVLALISGVQGQTNA
ncbi:hypothetical protein [Vibrio cholerae]|uniref:Uncharacterized protein n=1 Tax=Vibrio cholerae TaxID=666 RepID=A0A7Z7YAQ6_VIBCL|nr:hypothetical protein [Vibrio cholerae]EMA3788835.1 hypothetical protein [Vibrio cholerae]PNV69119.1 hypothetical protein C1Y48_20070 [Vibrio cholerae]TBM41359.1 hypothetical protein EYB64_12350 [Vibrio cholerae]TVN17361.1 hypothetical protein FPW20_11025 [Vibrio cholerae]HAS3348754.1 hypothetical protein [Vibrio cholerae]